MVKVEEISKLPHSPGVYLFKDNQNKILYVGKAKDIKKRVKQYFSSRPNSPKTSLLVSKIDSIDFICTSSEKEALILEFNLIKRYRPRYNIVLRDDKSYLLFKLDLNHPFPRIQLTRKLTQKNNCKYFGPYTSARAARETYRIINKVFPIRKCRDTIFKNRTRPCLQYHIKRCLGPCCFPIKKEDYSEIVKEVVLFLKGKNTELIANLEKRMWEAADNLEFERAADIRNKIQEIKRTLEQQRVLLPNGVDMDVFAIEKDNDFFGVGILMLREGRVVDQKNFFFNLEKIEVVYPATNLHGIFSYILNSIIYQFYSLHTYIPDKILLSKKVLDPHLIEFLEEKRGKKIQIISPTTTEYKDLIKLATLNIFKQKPKNHMGELVGISKLIGMSNIPRRIEIIDASHIMGSHTMVGMVVFEDGELKKDEYRIYRLVELDATRDDYLTLLSWTKKRFLSGPPWPDLLIIDGGIGQLNAVRAGFRELFNGNIPFKLISIAKSRSNDRGDKIYLVGRKNPVLLPKDSKELLFIQFLRDNVHRYVISKTRMKARKRSLETVVQKVNGVGPKTSKLLWSHFNSLENILNASYKDLKTIPGIGEKRAKQIYVGLQKIKEEAKT